MWLTYLSVLQNIEDSEEEEEEDKNGLPALLESSLKASCLQSENKLWQRSKHHGNVSEIMEFYVNSLMPPIVPNKLPTASKMRRLSSIPGREKSFVADDLDRSAEVLYWIFFFFFYISGKTFLSLTLYHTIPTFKDSV